MKKILEITSTMTTCKNCGHTRDYHEQGDVLYKLIFGIKIKECQHYTRDESQPIWKRPKKQCKCQKFEPYRTFEPY